MYEHYETNYPICMNFVKSLFPAKKNDKSKLIADTLYMACLHTKSNIIDFKNDREKNQILNLEFLNSKKNKFKNFIKSNHYDLFEHLVQNSSGGFGTPGGANSGKGEVALVLSSLNLFSNPDKQGDLYFKSNPLDKEKDFYIEVKGCDGRIPVSLQKGKIINQKLIEFCKKNRIEMKNDKSKSKSKRPCFKNSFEDESWLSSFEPNVRKNILKEFWIACDLKLEKFPDYANSWDDLFYPLIYEAFDLFFSNQKNTKIMYINTKSEDLDFEIIQTPQEGLDFFKIRTLNKKKKDFYEIRSYQDNNITFYFRD